MLGGENKLDGRLCVPYEPNLVSMCIRLEGNRLESFNSGYYWAS